MNSEASAGDGNAGKHALAPGRLGTGGVVLLTMAMVAPIGAVTSATALGIALGNGPGMPGIYLLAGLILLCFAGGYAAMSRHVTNAGAAYAYVTRAFGRRSGLAVGTLALLTYNAAFWAVSGAFGFYAHLVFQEQLGIDLPWEAWLAIAIAVVAFLGRHRIDLNATVLGIAVVVEVGILLVLDGGILIDRGLDAFSFHSFHPDVVFGGAVGVAIVMGFYSFGGFEATAIFSEEARNPRRTIARATYLAVAVIAIFYTLTAWALVSAYGANQVQAVALEEPGSFVFLTNLDFVGPTSTDILQYLVVTSLFASLLGIHNTASRYFFSLGRDRLLPEALGRTHPKTGAPHIASTIQIALAVVVLGIFALVGADPLLTVATSLGGLTTVCTMTLWALTSLAAATFFSRRREVRLSTVIAPSFAGAALLGLIVLALHNYDILSGATGGLVNQLPWLVVVALVGGFLYATWLRSSKPETYVRIGGEDAEPWLANTLVDEAHERAEAQTAAPEGAVES